MIFPIDIWKHIINYIDNIETLKLDEDADVEIKSNEDLIFEFLEHQEFPGHIKRVVLYKVIKNLLRTQEMDL